MTKDAIKNLELILDLIESTLPLESIYADMCNDSRMDRKPEYEECLEYTKKFIEILGISIDEALKMEPIVGYQQYHEQLRKVLA
jgi:hypothetical protein